MKLVTTLLLMMAVFTLSAQSGVNKANDLFEKKAYVKATKLYKDVIESDEEITTETLLKAADAHYYINEHREAAQIYEKAQLLSSSDLGEPFLLRYYQSLRGIREYERADALYREYLQSANKTVQLQEYEEAVRKFDSLRKDDTPSQHVLQNLDINTEYSEFSPIYYDNKVIFSSSRPGASKELYAWNQQPYLSLFVADKTEDGTLQNVEIFSKQVGTNYHDATIAFVPDTDRVFFTTSNVEKNKLVLDGNNTNNFKLYTGTIQNGVISNKEEVHFNSNTYSVGHPAVSPDGKYLVFASDMPGGYGEADLYFCKIYEDGMLSDPQNLGPKVNTWGNDFFPYIADQTLYFSSDGRVGFGGLDLYETAFTPKTGFLQPNNLGKGINSVADDFGYILNPEDNTGYVSSNRTTGMGDDDIYYFSRIPLECNQWLTGTVQDVTTKRPIFNVSVVVTDTEGNELETTVTDAAGEFIMSQPCSEEYVIVANKSGYFESSQRANTGKQDDGKADPVSMWLKNAEEKIVQDAETGEEKIDLAPIFFQYDKSKVTPKAAVVLDEAVDLMKKYPEMVIKIEAHTDARGSADYNLKLSDKRAKATKAYLHSQGIAEERIMSAKGFGESQPLNDCLDGTKCSENEHAVNRRSNFIILER
ncbi:OmpA family protein [Flavobacteriaceae bacterium TK19130]|nr:OmpA family protein [Thermobacterium salinum]